MKDEPKMNENNKHHAYDDDLSLVEIYLTIKANGALFLGIALFTFLCSLLFAYITYSLNRPSETVTPPKVEYSLWLEIGELVAPSSRRKLLIDDPNNAVEKVRNIYATQAINALIESGGKELSTASVSAESPNNSYLIVLKIIGEENNAGSYVKVLNTIANHLIEDHNSRIDEPSSKFRFNYQPTKIVQQFSKKVPPPEPEPDYTPLLIPLLGLVLGVFLGFFAIFVKGFFRRVREVEDRD